MTEKVLNKWIKLSIFSLFIVAALGLLMRYKIGFSFPYLDQKNLQHAHSHFAFAGWITQTLFVFLVHSLDTVVNAQRRKIYAYLLSANWLTAAGMLVSFIAQGYALYSILFSSVSIVIAFTFAAFFWKDIKYHKNQISALWYKWALVFMALSTLGTLSLIYMMVTRKIDQHMYLASVYWYLHFQYNGWFFFACIGLLFNYFGKHHSYFTTNLMAVRLLAFSCVPAYGLSVLWMHLPLWVEVLIAIAALTQAAGWGLYVYNTYQSKVFEEGNLTTPVKWILMIVAIAGSIKICLQLGSTIPAVSKLAFGFRPIVIAYLHLVLLAFISLLLISYSFMVGGAVINKTTLFGVSILVIGVLLNELLLAIQGIASFSYTLIPHINTLLFIAAIFLAKGALLLFISQFVNKFHKT